MAESAFLLSDFTQALWLDKGGMQLSKIREQGDNFDRGYRIYLTPQSCRFIATKWELILDTMIGIMDGLIDSPCNIGLYRSQVVRLSHFYDEIYYGIHTLDVHGQPRVGKGMNLIEEENRSLTMQLIERYAPDQLKKYTRRLASLDKAESAKNVSELDGKQEATKGKKRSRPSQGTSSESSETVSEPGKKRSRPSQGTSSESSETVSEPKIAKKTDKPEFAVTLYGWLWYNDNDQYVSQGESQGGWHYNPKECFSEAMQFKPTDENLSGNYKLDVFDKTDLIQIDKELMDAALSKLVKVNVALCVAQDKELDLYTSDWQDIGVYGKTVLERISTTEVYDLCKKALKHYVDNITQNMELIFMKKFADFSKEDQILSVIANGGLKANLVELFDYIYEL